MYSKNNETRTYCQFLSSRMLIENVLYYFSLPMLALHEFVTVPWAADMVIPFELRCLKSSDSVTDQWMTTALWKEMLKLVEPALEKRFAAEGATNTVPRPTVLDSENMKILMTFARNNFLSLKVVTPGKTPAPKMWTEKVLVAVALKATCNVPTGQSSDLVARLHRTLGLEYNHEAISHYFSK